MQHEATNFPAAQPLPCLQEGEASAYKPLGISAPFTMKCVGQAMDDGNGRTQLDAHDRPMPNPPWMETMTSRVIDR